MAWVWVRCRLCRREVQASDMNWDQVLKVEACKECREAGHEKLRKKAEAKRQVAG